MCPSIWLHRDSFLCGLGKHAFSEQSLCCQSKLLGSGGCSWGNWAKLMPNSGCSCCDPGPDGEPSLHISQLCSTSHSPSPPFLISFHLAHPPSAWVTNSPACQTSGPSRSLLHALLGSAHWQGLVGTSGACPSPLLSFVEAAPLGHEARGRAIAIGRRELHTGRGDRRGGREFSQTHSQPGDCGKAERPTV